MRKPPCERRREIHGVHGKVRRTRFAKHVTAGRITIHNASWDYGGKQPRHGTRVTSLAERPFFDAKAPTRRQALGLLDDEEKEALRAATEALKDFSL